MKTSDFDYELPPEAIAQTPIEPRDASRLMVLDRRTHAIAHHHFYDLPAFLQAGDLLVLNETRVIPARLYAHKIPSGGRVELLLLVRQADGNWQALVKGKHLKVGQKLQVEGGPQAEIVALLEGSARLIHFAEAIEPLLDRIGHVPLPPYIHTPLSDPERYQTVYARLPGSVAAPTAGLHFTPRLLEELRRKGILTTTITLHVGLDTFAPVTEPSPEKHRIHTEWCRITPDSAALVNQTRQRGGRIVAVGTTSVRALESAAHLAQPGELISAFEGSTDLYILPGFTFRAVDALITNFHLPRSTLIMLVSAFAGREFILCAYRRAIEQGYRFYSFGDAMLIL